MEHYLYIIFAIIAVLIILKLFSLPIKWFFKLFINTALGFLWLLLFNWLGSFIGVTIGVNIINALVVGVLGLPGFILLLLLKWFLVI